MSKGNTIIRLTSIFTAYLFLFLLIGTGLPAKAAVSPKLSNTAVKKGKQTTMKLSGLDEKQYPPSSLTWTSSDKKIAVVSQDGKITGKAPGKAKITVKVKNTKIRLTGTVRVVSFFRTKKVEVTNKPDEPMLTGTKLRLRATVSPSQARNKKILWSSSKEKVATITSKGTVKALKKGTTTITAAVKGTKIKTSFKLRVKKPVKLKKLTVTGDSQVYAGSFIALTAKLSPENTSYDNIIWKSSNKKVATVNAQGQVFGIKAGKATITAREKETKKKAKYKITVLKVPVTSMCFAPNTIQTMETGSKHTLSVQMAPGNATNKKINWKSSNKTEATVDENGTVTALRPTEEVVITATSSDNKKLSCTWTLRITKTNGYITKSTLDNLDLTVIDKVMISTHPDDETLWGGGHLLEDEYLVVCMTHGWNEKRRTAFIESMRTSNDKYIILDYPDVKRTYANGTYDADRFSTCRSAMQKDIRQILTYKKWKQVVTHNPDGEYGKYHHQQVSKMVTEEFNKNCKNPTELWYFGRYYKANATIPGEQIAPELLAVKRQMINRYYPTAQGAIKAFGHMIPYENWIPAGDWK